MITKDINQERLYNTEETALFLGVQKQTIYNWRNKRRGPNYVLIGSKPMYLRQDLDSYINSNRIILNGENHDDIN